MPGAQHMRDEGTRTVTAGKAGTAMETTKLGAFAHGDKTGTRDPQESHRALCCWTTRDVTDAMLVRGQISEAEV